MRDQCSIFKLLKESYLSVQTVQLTLLEGKEYWGEIYGLSVQDGQYVEKITPKDTRHTTMPVMNFADGNIEAVWKASASDAEFLVQ